MDFSLPKNNLDRYFFIARKIYHHYRYLRPFAHSNQGKNNLADNSTISIFSSPRGGSTWLSEILCKIPQSFLVWEPLYLEPLYPELKKVNFCWDPFIPEDTEWKEAEEFFRRLFNREVGSLRSLRIYFMNDLTQVKKARYFIYKDVDSNMLIPWLTRRFNINPVFIIRHPCAVVASQFRYKHWDSLIENPQLPYYEKHCRYAEIYETYSDILARVKRPEERLAANWALHNSVPILHKENDQRWITVAYERLYSAPHFEIQRIFERLGIDIPADLIKNIRKPSSTAIGSSFDKIENGLQLESWRTSLGEKVISNILNITREFGLDFYDQGPEPDYSRIYHNPLLDNFK